MEDYNNAVDSLFDDDDAQKDKFLTFVVDNEVYGFGIEHVSEIVGVQHITVVPDLQSYIKGVVNLRGLVIPVVDVRLRFGLDERCYDDRTCIIIVQHDDTAVGLIVDIVREVIKIAEDIISPAPKIVGEVGGQYISRIAKLEESVVLLLDIQSLLYEDKKGRSTE